MKMGGDPVSTPVMPDEVKAACKKLGVAPESLLGWRVYGDQVAVVLADGRKVSLPLESPPLVPKPVIPSRVKKK